MRRLILLEMKMWWRNSRLLILFFLFAFFGITSPVLIYYMKEFLATFGGTEGTIILMPDPNWKALMESYFSNISQIGLFVLVYFTADTFKLKKESSLGLYYSTVARNSIILWTPKLFLAFLVTLVSNLVGVVSATYVTWVFFPEIELSRVLSSSLVQSLALLTLVIFGSAVTVWTRKAFLAVVSTIVLMVVSSIIQTLSDISEWLPLSLLSPINVLNAPGQVNLVTVGICVGIIVLSIMAILVRPLRVKY
ncbi:MAG: hypothetical protein RSD60_06695 [Lactococcus sp.]